jgi:hypothetical protein
MSATQANVRSRRNLHTARLFGYHSAVRPSSLIGCGSPKARGAEPQPARYAAFLFQTTSFGGQNGEASASPVTLRVPRSSTPVLAAALRGSLSAVVHQAQLEINMKINTSPGASALLASDLLVQISPRWITRFSGTSAQLVAEDLIPPQFAWPQGRQTKTWQAGRYKYSVCRCRIPGVKGPMSGWSDGDFWALDYEPTGKSCSFQDHLIYRKKRELAEIVRRQTPEWSDQYVQAHAAKRDVRYMAFRDLLASTPATQGAAA